MTKMADTGSGHQKIKIERIFGVEILPLDANNSTRYETRNVLEICSFYVFFQCLPWEHLEYKKIVLDFFNKNLKSYFNKGIFFKSSCVYKPDRIRKYYKFWKYYKYKMPDIIFPEGVREEFETIDQSGENYFYSGIIHLSNIFDPRFINHFNLYGFQSYRQCIPIILSNDNNQNDIRDLLTKDIKNSYLDRNYYLNKSIELIEKKCVLMHAFGRDNFIENGIAIHCPIEFCTLFDSVRNEVDYKTILNYQPSTISSNLGAFTKIQNLLEIEGEYIHKIKT